MNPNESSPADEVGPIPQQAMSAEELQAAIIDLASAGGNVVETGRLEAGSPDTVVRFLTAYERLSQEFPEGSDISPEAVIGILGAGVSSLGQNILAMVEATDEATVRASAAEAEKDLVALAAFSGVILDFFRGLEVTPVAA